MPSKFNCSQKQVLRADLVGVGLVVIGDLAIRSPTPVLTACRQLLELGHDPGASLHCYRAGTLALVVSSIAAGADLEIAGSGVGFTQRKRPARLVTGSSVRNFRRAATRHQAT